MGPVAAGVAPQVADLLTNSNDWVRRSAAEAPWEAFRAQQPAGGVAPQVADCSRIPITGFAGSAAEALGRMGPAAASFAPQVADLLNSSDDEVRRSAAEALGRMGPSSGEVFAAGGRFAQEFQ